MPLLIFRGIATFLFRRKQCLVVTVFVGVQFFFRIETFSTWFTFGLHIHDWIFRHLFDLFISPCSCPFFSLLLNSLLSWLGDLFFLLQEPLNSSFNSKLKVSLPILKPKENSLLSADSAWQKAKHFSITALSILGSYFQVGVWTKNFDGKWKSYAYPVWKSILCKYVFSQRWFEEAFDSIQRRKVKQMQPVWLCIIPERQFSGTFENAWWRKNKYRQCD